MAEPLKICFGSRQISTEYIKKYQCTKFHTFRPIRTIAPLTARTSARGIIIMPHCVVNEDA